MTTGLPTTGQWGPIAVFLACGALSCVEDTPRRSALHVYAASSLTEAFTDLEVAFETTHPGVDVQLSFAGSQVLQLQIQEGAPAHAFASADPEHMASLETAGLVLESHAFAFNELVIIVPLANSANINSFVDLPLASRLVLGTHQVPVGRYAREVIAASADDLPPGFEASVLRSLVSEESNTRLVRAKVELGEADAAIVYRTDAMASDRLRVIEIPAEINVRGEYRIGVIEGSPLSSEAAQWMDFVLSSEGKAILARRGFGVE